jgi:hypothetical protein
MSDDPLPVSTTLPESARERLIKAAAVENGHGDPRARQKAIEIATNIIKTQYPQFFHLKEIKPWPLKSK